MVPLLQIDARLGERSAGWISALRWVPYSEPHTQPHPDVPCSDRVDPYWPYVNAHLSNDLCQPRVTHNQPAPRSDAVGLILELMRL